MYTFPTYAPTGIETVGSHDTLLINAWIMVNVQMRSSQLM